MPEDKYDENTEMRRLLAELQRENREIKQAIGEIAQANVLPGIVQHGFNNVIAQLRPLRDLTPKRESVPQEVADAAAAMLAAMEGVVLPGGSLGISEVNVPFIGQPRPQLVVSGPGQSGAVLQPVGQGNPSQAGLPDERRYQRGNQP